MRSGALRTKIVINSATTTRSATGAPVEAFDTVIATFRADVRDIKAENRFLSQRFNSMVTKQLYVRYVPGLEAGMRFELDGATWQIEPPRDITGRKRSLELLASEVLDV
ncbi:phage head closure protein [Sulfurimonas sp. HSL1-6]|uniref:phage head closure protein n=1 Tax=Thiomicrolovo immobilis TaxID=3131935 RepID=UPI0031F93C69